MGKYLIINKDALDKYHQFLLEKVSKDSGIVDEMVAAETSINFIDNQLPSFTLSEKETEDKFKEVYKAGGSCYGEYWKEYKNKFL